MKRFLILIIVLIALILGGARSANCDGSLPAGEIPTEEVVPTKEECALAFKAATKYKNRLVYHESKAVYVKIPEKGAKFKNDLHVLDEVITECGWIFHYMIFKGFKYVLTFQPVIIKDSEGDKVVVWKVYSMIRVEETESIEL